MVTCDEKIKVLSSQNVLLWIFCKNKILNLKVCWIKSFISGLGQIPLNIKLKQDDYTQHCLLQPYSCVSGINIKYICFYGLFTIQFIIIGTLGQLVVLSEINWSQDTKHWTNSEKIYFLPYEHGLFHARRNERQEVCTVGSIKDHTWSFISQLERSSQCVQYIGLEMKSLSPPWTQVSLDNF